MATAATPERKHATCQAVNVVALIAAPPVEKRKAAPRTCRRERALLALVVSWPGRFRGVDVSAKSFQEKTEVTTTWLASFANRFSPLRYPMLHFIGLYFVNVAFISLFFACRKIRPVSDLDELSTLWCGLSETDIVVDGSLRYPWQHRKLSLPCNEPVSASLAPRTFFRML